MRAIEMHDDAGCMSMTRVVTAGVWAVAERDGFLYRSSLPSNNIHKSAPPPAKLFVRARAHAYR